MAATSIASTLRTIGGTAVVVAVGLLTLGFGYRHLTGGATPASSTSTATSSATAPGPPMGPVVGGPRRPPTGPPGGLDGSRRPGP